MENNNPVKKKVEKRNILLIVVVHINTIRVTIKLW